MNFTNYMSLKVVAKSSNEAFARSVVAAFCVDANPTMDQINDIKTAVSEAVTNSIVHGYEGRGEGIIEITASLNDKLLHIEIRDFGVGISDIAKARQPFYTTRPDDERSGLGFTVIESFMDGLSVENCFDGGLVVKMDKNLDVNIVKNGEKDC